MGTLGSMYKKMVIMRFIREVKTIGVVFLLYILFTRYLNF